MSDLSNMDDWGFIANTVRSDGSLGRSDPWPYVTLRATLLWAGGVVPEMSHNVADLVERTIDRGEA